jgi:hypothetical protein
VGLDGGVKTHFGTQLSTAVLTVLGPAPMIIASPKGAISVCQLSYSPPGIKFQMIED